MELKQTFLKILPIITRILAGLISVLLLFVIFLIAKNLQHPLSLSSYLLAILYIIIMVLSIYHLITGEKLLVWVFSTIIVLPMVLIFMKNFL